MGNTTKTRFELISSFEDTEEGTKEVYGISAYDENGAEIFTMNDITCDGEALKELIDVCNRSGLSIVHIRDIINDFVELQGSY